MTLHPDTDLAERAQAGRSCPLDYRYHPRDLAGTPRWPADSLYVVGGLYGNVEALETVERMAALEPVVPQIVFNGDFHWFDVQPDCFARIDAGVARHRALRGNVETELAAERPGAGCGCAYPDWVEQTVVDRSNAIIERLRDSARAGGADLGRLAALPMWQCARVGGLAVGIVHGDLHSLAGWSLSPAGLDADGGLDALASDMRAADIRLLASTHTCLAQFRTVDGGRCVLVNNGAAGMPNLRGSHCGLLTRIAVQAPPPGMRVLHGEWLDGVHVALLAIDHDHDAWCRRFLTAWPAGSPAHDSYWPRIRSGPDVGLDELLGCV